MLLRLSRLSFWLAAAVAALALLAPGGHETLLTAVAGAASLLALGLWRAALRGEQRRLLAQWVDAPATPVLDNSALRSKLGAGEARVDEVHGVDDSHAQLSDLVESQPGFRTVLRRIRLDADPLAALLAPAGATLSERAAGPVEAAEDRQRRPAPIAPSPLRLQPTHANVLVVEDNVVQPERTTRMLRRLGCRVTAASGMLDGLNLLCRRQFDLILIDMQMSGMGGAEGLRRLRQNPGGAHRFMSATDTPAIALSVPGLPGDEERLRQLGFDDHLFKPFRQSQMLAMLSKHLPPAAPVVSTDAPPEPERLAVLDPGALARLTELDPTGESHLLERVLQAFQGSVARLRPQLDEAQRNGDRTQIRLVAHTLKSSSASIGALWLSQLCGQIEAAIRLEAAADLVGPLGSFDAALDGALQAIDALLKERV